MRYFLIILVLVLIAFSGSCYAETEKIHEYNIWTNIVYGTTFMDSWDFCIELEKKVNGKWEQVVVIEEKEGKEYNIAAYLFRAAYTKEQCRELILEKVEEWKKTLMEKPYNYKIDWKFNRYN